MALKTVEISVAQAIEASSTYTNEQIAFHASDLYLGSMEGLAILDNTAALSWDYNSVTKKLSGLAVGSLNSSNIATASGVSSYVVGSKIFLIFTRQTTTSSGVPWSAQSGPYLVNVVGNGSTVAELIRAPEFYTLADVNLGAFANVTAGTYAATATFLSSKGGGSFDATPLVFSMVGTGTPGNLPSATGAGAYPRSTGVGTTYTAVFPVLQGLLAARPAASASLQGTSYLATDLTPPLLYQCISTGPSTYGWYLQAAGISAAEARDSIGAGTSSVALASTAPAALGVTNVGIGTTAARSDHVHPLPTAATIGAIATSSLSNSTPAAPGSASPGVATSVSRSDHVHAPTTATQVGLGAVTATGADAATARAVISAVATTRSIGTTAGLSGGGTLSGDLTLSATNAAVGPRHIPLGGYATVSAVDGTMVIGGSPEALGPSDFSITGKTTVWTLRLVASVVSPETLTVVLYNLTDSTTAATITVTETTPTAKSASVTVPGGAKLFELRASCSGSTNAEYGVINSSSLKVHWT